jgi:zinc transport system ATP-binding protein
MGVDVTLKNLNVELGSKLVLDNINLKFEANKINALIGPNGAGKTTLIHTLLGLTNHSGEILFNGNQKRPTIGFVPQNVNTERGAPVIVADFLASGITKRPVWFGQNKRIKLEVEKTLESVGIPDRINRRIDELSGGEFQRVLLAQALIREPDLLILDEPNTGMDVTGHSLFCSLVERVHSEREVTTILITHELGVVADHAHRAIGLNKSVIFEGDSPDVLNSDNLVALFGPHSNLWAQCKHEDCCKHEHEVKG